MVMRAGWKGEESVCGRVNLNVKLCVDACEREEKEEEERERRRRRGGEKRDTHGETKIEKERERDRKALSSPRPSAESFRGARARRDDECDEGEAGGRRCKQEDADDG